MRILNNIKSRNKYFYQQHTNSEINAQRFLGLTLTLEKPTRGKPVRERLFIISELKENLLQQSLSSEINYRLISKTVPSFLLRI
jgi:hypothetical protein